MTGPEPNEQTRAAEAAEAETSAHADRPPTPEEARAAERNELDPDVAEHFEEMNRIGAEARGEGRID